MQRDMTTHKFRNIKLVSLDYLTFHLYQASTYLMLINSDFLALINSGTMNI